eukprot:gene12728-biopygen21499
MVNTLETREGSTSVDKAAGMHHHMIEIASFGCPTVPPTQFTASAAPGTTARADPPFAPEEAEAGNTGTRRARGGRQRNTGESLKITGIFDVGIGFYPPGMTDLWTARQVPPGGENGLGLGKSHPDFFWARARQVPPRKNGPGKWARARQAPRHRPTGLGKGSASPLCMCVQTRTCVGGGTDEDVRRGQHRRGRASGAAQNSAYRAEVGLRCCGWRSEESAPCTPLPGTALALGKTAADADRTRTGRGAHDSIQRERTWTGRGTDASSAVSP